MEEAKGGRVCASCIFHHPEREKKPCSVFGRCVSKGNCAAYSRAIFDQDKLERGFASAEASKGLCGRPLQSFAPHPYISLEEAPHN